jgi:hypothetical protein
MQPVRAAKAFPALAGQRRENLRRVQPTIAVDVGYGRVRQGWLREPMCRSLAKRDAPIDARVIVGI